MALCSTQDIAGYSTNLDELYLARAGEMEMIKRKGDEITPPHVLSNNCR
jgi:hypothetical protein